MRRDKFCKININRSYDNIKTRETKHVDSKSWYFIRNIQPTQYLNNDDKQVITPVLKLSRKYWNLPPKKLKFLTNHSKDSYIYYTSASPKSYRNKKRRQMHQRWHSWNSVYNADRHFKKGETRKYIENLKQEKIYYNDDEIMSIM